MGKLANRRSVFRFSLKALLILVVPISAGLAALRDATDAWFCGVVTVTLLAIFTATLAAIYGSRSRRPVWGSFAICCGGYFLLVATSVGSGVISTLVTTKVNEFLLERIHPRIDGPGMPLKSMIPVVGRLEQSDQPEAASKCHVIRAESHGQLLALGPLYAIFAMVEPDTSDTQGSADKGPSNAEPADKSDSDGATGDLLGAVEPPEIADNFLHIAQCLWALVLGGAGSIAALCVSRAERECRS